MSRTAWSQGSSVPSNNSQKGRNKGKNKANAPPPKSQEILRLEGLLEGVKNSQPQGRKDPKGGCFCQARKHPISPYTPICKQCGLVLCSLQAPYHSCPHCTSSLLSPSSREALVHKLTSEISDVLTREREHREQEELQRQKTVNAFPTLSTTTSSTLPGNTQAYERSSSQQPRKVLSLHGQTRKVTVVSYASTPSSPRVSSSKEPEPTRQPPPPRGVSYVKGNFNEEERWTNLRRDRIYYVPISDAEDSGGGRKQKKGVETT